MVRLAGVPRLPAELGELPRHVLLVVAGSRRKNPLVAPELVVQHARRHDKSRAVAAGVVQLAAHLGGAGDDVHVDEGRLQARPVVAVGHCDDDSLVQPHDQRHVRGDLRVEEPDLERAGIGEEVFGPPRPWPAPSPARPRSRSFPSIPDPARPGPSDSVASRVFSSDCAAAAVSPTDASSRDRPLLVSLWLRNLWIRCCIPPSVPVGNAIITPAATLSPFRRRHGASSRERFFCAPVSICGGGGCRLRNKRWCAVAVAPGGSVCVFNERHKTPFTPWRCGQLAGREDESRGEQGDSRPVAQLGKALCASPVRAAPGASGRSGRLRLESR